MNINITDPIFHDEAKALAHLESDRWPDGERCVPSVKALASLHGRQNPSGHVPLQCVPSEVHRANRNGVERSHVPLHKWLLATHLMAASKKG